MDIPELIGNEDLKARLYAQIKRRGLSHAYLLSGPFGSGKHTLAQLLAAALLCTDEAGRPCGTCQNCRKVWHNIHPDVIQAHAPAVGEVRILRKDAYIRPNEGVHKVYIIDGMEKVHPAAQNALLKVLEEGPEYAAFLLLTEDETCVIETIQSRCDKLKLAPVDIDDGATYLHKTFPHFPLEEIKQEVRESGGYLGRAIKCLTEKTKTQDLALSCAEECIICLQKQNPIELLECAVRLENLSREEWPVFLKTMEERLHQKLHGNIKQDGTQWEKAQLNAYLKIIQMIKMKYDANVGTGHCAGLLHVLCGEIMERGAR